MFLKKFLDFVNESILHSSEGFQSVLKMMSNPVSDKLLELMGTDIKTTFNAINITDMNDTISFVSDSQLQNKIKQGLSIEDVFSGSGMRLQISSVIRTIKRIMEENKIDFDHSTYIKFGDQFKAAWTFYQFRNSDRDLPIREVSGDEIRYWYNESKYCKKTLNGHGTLGKSCMRFEECQDFFSMYTQNPNKVRMIIMTDEENLLLSRALVWTTDRGHYLDRVYYTDSSEEEMIRIWFKENHQSEMMYPEMKPMTVKLENINGPYPYMDTFQFFDRDSGNITNFIPKSGDIYTLDDTDGGQYPLYDEDY